MRKDWCKKMVVASLMGCFSLLLSPEISAATYTEEAYGRDEGAALGNLKMSALRDSLKNIITEKEIKDYARVLRTEIFLHVDSFVTPGDDLVYEKKNQKIFAKGSMNVDEEALYKKLADIPEFRNVSLNGGSAQQTSAQPNVSVMERKQVMPANEFINLVINHSGNEQSIIEALNAGMDPDTRRKIEGVETGEPAIYLYISNGGSDTNVLDAFISQRPDVMWKDDDGFTVVLEKLMDTDDHVVGRVLDELNPDFRQAKFKYDSPVSVYLSGEHVKHSGDVDVVKNLQRMIKLGCNPNEVTESNGGKRFKPVIFSAVRKDSDNLWSPAVLETLLSSGANPNGTDEKGKTALFIAVAENAPEHISLLCRFKADPNAVNKQGRTALMYHVEKTSEAAAYDALIKAGADVNFVSTADDGFTPLIVAVEANNAGLVKLLLGAKADVNKTDRAGMYPLSHAVVSGSVEMINLLMEAGADLSKAVNAAYDSKQTVYQYLKDNDMPDDPEYTAVRKLVMEKVNQ
jgi:hypothetical protein